MEMKSEKNTRGKRLSREKEALYGLRIMTWPETDGSLLLPCRIILSCKVCRRCRSGFWEFW